MPSPEPIVYIYTGEDEPTLRERLDAFIANLLPDPTTIDLNLTSVEGASVSLGDIQSAAGALPFLAEVRVVLVENFTESGPDKDALKDIGTLITDLPNSTRLVFLEIGLNATNAGTEAARRRLNTRKTTLKKFINLVEKDPRGKVESFDAPRDLRGWIVDRAARHNAEIEPRAASLLADRIGDDLTLVDTELVKLATYTAGERPINSADVELLTPFTPEANIWHMVDALGQRDGAQALVLLRQLLDAGDEPIRIFSLVVRQYRLLIQMREHLDTGGNAGSATSALGMRDFVARKVAGQANRYSLSQLERIYAHLLDVDMSMKGGMDSRDGLDRMIPAKDGALALEELVARLAGRG